MGEAAKFCAIFSSLYGKTEHVPKKDGISKSLVELPHLLGI